MFIVAWRQVFVILLYILSDAPSSASAFVDAFISPSSWIKAQHPQPHLLEIAAKKKKTKKQIRIPLASGKGFGRQVTKSTIEEEETQSYTSSIPHANLITWLKQNPNTYITSKFSIQPSPLGGYGGFVINSPIKKNELIFQIPRECCVTYEDALSDSECGKAFRIVRNSRIASYGMILIAGWIAKEYLLAKEYSNYTSLTTTSNDGSRIKHWEYIQTLPWNQGELNQDHVIYWSDDEVETLLQNSLAYDDALLIRKTVDNAIKIISEVALPIIQRARLSGETLQPTEADDNESDDRDREDIMKKLEHAIKGAFVIALSRSFAEEVVLDDGSIEVENLLLPLIDILQHSNTPNTILEPYEDYILLRARRDIDVGEELFHQYQEEKNDVIPPYKFFTRYGFIPGRREPIRELLKSRDSLFFD